MWQNFLAWLRKKLGVRSPSEEHAKACAPVVDAFQRGLEEGMKNPLYRFEAGRIVQVREMTPEEKKALAIACEITRSTFPGYFDDEVDDDGV